MKTKHLKIGGCSYSNIYREICNTNAYINKKNDFKSMTSAST